MEGDQEETNLERARNLFRFLLEAQRLRSKPVRRVDSYEKVYWLGDLPDKDTVWSRLRSADPESESPIFSIQRVPRDDPPEPDLALAPWITGGIHDADRIPSIAEVLPAFRVPDRAPRENDPIESVDDDKPAQVYLEDHPDVRDSYGSWSTEWASWAALERERRDVRQAYGDLFQTYVTLGAHPEEFELVLGISCIAWAPPGQDRVQRHVFTTPAAIAFDDDSGTLTVTVEPGPEPMSIELEMIDPGLLKNHQHVTRLQADVAEFQGHPLDRNEVSQLARQLVFALDPSASFDADANEPISPGRDLAGAFAPAVILRRRSQRGMIDVFERISQQLAEATEVPKGLLPLVDPDHRHHIDSDPTPGGIVRVDDEMFLPLPVNQQQLKVLQSVDTKAQTVVQGPPGTGKTHTAAALLTHLLAQGKRVLVTAQTDRALEEVRQKLPEAVRPLSVAVIGSSRSDMADLKVAVDRISSRAAEHDSDLADMEIKQTLNQIDGLSRRRAAVYGELLAARQHEVAEHQQPFGSGTLAGLARRYQEYSDEHEWISRFVDVQDGTSPPLSDAEMVEWLALLRDEELREDSTDARARLASQGFLPEPNQVATWFEAEEAAIAALRTHETAEANPAYESVRRLSGAQRMELQRTLGLLADHIQRMEARPETWVGSALRDVRSGRPDAWQARAQQVDALIRTTGPLVDSLGPLTRVQVLSGELPALRAVAVGLLEALNGGASIKTTPDGKPKINVFTSKAVKEARPLFESIRVDGLPPTQTKQLEQFVTFVDAGVSLEALERAWPAGTDIPEEDTLHEQLQWHVGELQQLRAVLELGQRIRSVDSFVRSIGVTVPDWTDVRSIRTLASLVDTASARDMLLAAQEPLDELLQGLEAVTRWEDAGESVQTLRGALAERQLDLYAGAYRRHGRLHECRAQLDRAERLAEALEATAPALRAAIERDPDDEIWTQRLASISRSWAWAATGSWIVKQEPADVNSLQAQITAYETQIRGQVESLAAHRAWNHALNPARITGQARADLNQYAYLVRRLGKGTGKYAAQQRSEIRQAMERCRASVPVWIMPLYRIAEQFRVHEDMFDVILVDEASQAGLDATFLQYLAPKIVVVGDDKQVSPAAVGVDQEQLRSLADHYLPHDRYKASWQDPKRSVFDEAMMRYGNQITLVEHRRCVPEIIGFSNRIAYEPDNVRLIPVRQYGADRLDPIKVVRVEDGYTQGTSSRVNRPEVEAIVHAIEECLSDPAYDGLTMGVISLLGPAQAKAIEAELLARLDPDVWDSRQLRCGDSADFQGSERNVMFLSLVATIEPGRRLAALTADQYVQRYNVAASRAKDQMWVFHSMPLSELRNPEDMRFQLLDYCYGAERRLTADDGSFKESVPNDVPVAPFDSLFEQRVFNRLYDRGYSVIPQFPAEGYSIDLVVVGASRRLAVECDGDHWHGPEAYQKDLARQRELERCGWTFHRIRESAFYLDESSALSELWNALEAAEIYPSGRSDDSNDVPDPESWDVRDNPEDAPDGRGNDRAHEHEDAPDELAHNEHESDRPEVDDHNDDEDGYPALREFGESGIQQFWGEEFSDEPAYSNGRPSGGHRDESEISDQADLTEQESATDCQGLIAYRAFSGEVVHPDRASKTDLIDGIVRIVAAEGPMLGSRLQSVYVRAAGGQRVGRNLARELNSAMSSAMRRGRIIAANPLNKQGLKFRAYRLADQPPVVVRELGPRSIEEVPRTELARLIEDETKVAGSGDQSALYRRVLARLGLRRLTSNAQTVLDEATDVIRTEPSRAAEESEPLLDWTTSLFESPQYATQKARAGRGSVDDAVVRDVLIALVRLGERGSFELIEEEAGLRAGRLREVLPSLRRMLNVDGYQVLAVVDDGMVTVDSTLLSTQFGIGQTSRMGELS